MPGAAPAPFRVAQLEDAGKQKLVINVQFPSLHRHQRMLGTPPALTGLHMPGAAAEDWAAPLARLLEASGPACTAVLRPVGSTALDVAVCEEVRCEGSCAAIRAVAVYSVIDSLAANLPTHEPSFFETKTSLAKPILTG